MDAESSGCGDRVHVGPEEQEFPAVLFLLAHDHPAYLVKCVMSAGILHAVCRDDEDRMFGTILFPGIFVDIADMMDRFSQCVQQSCASSDIVFLFCHRTDL